MYPGNYFFSENKRGGKKKLYPYSTYRLYQRLINSSQKNLSECHADLENRHAQLRLTGQAGNRIFPPDKDTGIHIKCPYEFFFYTFFPAANNQAYEQYNKTKLKHHIKFFNDRESSLNYNSNFNWLLSIFYSDHLTLYRCSKTFNRCYPAFDCARQTLRCVRLSSRQYRLNLRLYHAALSLYRLSLLMFRFSFRMYRGFLIKNIRKSNKYAKKFINRNIFFTNAYLINIIHKQLIGVQDEC